MGHLERPPEPNLKGSDTPQVSSVVRVPGKGRAESAESCWILALGARLKEKYGDTFFTGRPLFPSPGCGPYGEAKIRLEPAPSVYRHRELAPRSASKEAIETLLLEVIDRVWLEPCHSKSASPCFVVPK